MGIIYVKNAKEMIAQNRLFYKREESAQFRILQRMAQTNMSVSKDLAKTHNFTGELVSAIRLKEENKLKWQVICSAPHAYEIEEGLKELQFRTYAEYPKLRAWAEEKFGEATGNGIVVGRSLDGIPHPRGLHFMYEGYNINVINANSIVSQELMKLNN